MRGTVLPNEFNFAGKVAVITGGGSGIGKSVSLALAERGACVVLVGRTEKKLSEVATLIRRRGGVASQMVGDMTDAREVRRVAEEAIREFGHIDILVHCVGSTLKKPAIEITEHEWRSVIDSNLTSGYLCAKHFGPHIIEAARSSGQYGKVIFIGSIGSFLGIPYSSAYCASKGGLVQFAKVLAVEWARYRVNVNVVTPGYIKTPLSDSVLSNPETYEKVISRIPLGEIGRPEDVASTIVFLVSQASNYLTGAIIPVDAGFLATAYTAELSTYWNGGGGI